jgi:hypothetical protein
MKDEVTNGMIISGIVLVIAITLTVYFIRQNQLCAEQGGIYVRTLLGMKCIGLNPY